MSHIWRPPITFAIETEIFHSTQNYTFFRIEHLIFLRLYRKNTRRIFIWRMSSISQNTQKCEILIQLASAFQHNSYLLWVMIYSMNAVNFFCAFANNFWCFIFRIWHQTYNWTKEPYQTASLWFYYCKQIVSEYISFSVNWTNEWVSRLQMRKTPSKISPIAITLDHEVSFSEFIAVEAVEFSNCLTNNFFKWSGYTHKKTTTVSFCG